MALSGRSSQTSLVSLCCFSVLLRVVVIDVAEAEVREAHVGLDSNRFLILFDGFRVAAEVSQRVAELVMCFGVVGSIGDCGLQTLDRVVVVFLFVVDPADLVVCRGVVGLNANGLSERRQGFGDIVRVFCKRSPIRNLRLRCWAEVR